MGKLTTHILDTSSGHPAAALKIALYRLEGDTRTHLKDVVTNLDGRIDAPLLEGEDFVVGRYELLFHAGNYFHAQGISLPETLFLDEIPIRFGISNAKQHYHVPLLLSPYGYSTYRGS